MNERSVVDPSLFEKVRRPLLEAESMPEDDATVERQHLDLRSRIWSSGRLSWAKPVVHMVDNWVLERVLKKRRIEARTGPGQFVAPMHH